MKPDFKTRLELAWERERAAMALKPSGVGTWRERFDADEREVEKVFARKKRGGKHMT